MSPLMGMDEDSRIAIDYLRGLPHEAVVRWSTHHLSAQEPWASRWVDVRIEDEDLRLSWVWTIIGDDDPDGTGPEQLWQFVWPYDLDVHEVWDPVRPPKVFGDLVGTWAVARGEAVPAAVAVALAEGPERRHLVLGGWSAETIEEAISRWTATHAHRPDLRFAWHPEGEPPAAVSEAAERAREIEAGGPTWDLGDGLVVADGLMDELLTMDPEDRDALIEIFRESRPRG